MSSKYAAFGVHLEVGTAQVETAVIVIDGPTFLLTSDGNGTVTLTHPGMTGTPLAESVALLEDDTADDVARKIAAHFNGLSDVTDHMTIVANGPNVIMRLLAGEANDTDLNMAYADDTCAGLTDDATSNNTTAGIDAVETAGVTNVAGPPLGVDTEDVTTHDQVTAWEQQVATIIRSGEVTLDIVYDPADNTQDATAVGGLAYRLKNRTLSYFDLIFRSTYNWTFFGYVNGFEPTGDVAGALTASVKIKIAEAPTLE